MELECGKSSQTQRNRAANCRILTPVELAYDGGTTYRDMPHLHDDPQIMQATAAAASTAPMPEAVLRRVGEPFFTTKEPGKGMGLGTFLVRTFAERLGGCVSFDSIAGQGTTVTLELPANTAPRRDYVAV